MPAIPRPYAINPNATLKGSDTRCTNAERVCSWATVRRYRSAAGNISATDRGAKILCEIEVSNNRDVDAAEVVVDPEDEVDVDVEVWLLVDDDVVVGVAIAVAQLVMYCTVTPVPVAFVPVCRVPSPKPDHF